MTRRLLNLLTALSLLLCIGFAFAWDRSRVTGDIFGYLTYGTNDGLWQAHGVMVTSGRGGVGVQWASSRLTDLRVVPLRQVQPPRLLPRLPSQPFPPALGRPAPQE